MDCFHCKGNMVKGNAPLVRTEMAIISHGNQFPHGSVRNAGKFFLKKMKSIIFKKHYRKLILKRWR
jgi:hypothetical protein